MNKSKGFTIIELIVVIAIIAILAAIVLVNVTVYINKAKDARINSDMGRIKTGMSGCFTIGNGATYAGCLVVGTGTPYVAKSLTDDITTEGGTAVVVTADANATTSYCASSKLNSGNYVCIDSTGVTKSSATSICTTTIFTCPS